MFPRARFRSVLATATAAALAVLALACSTTTAEAKPKIAVSTVVSGLNIPWDFTWVGDVLLYAERSGAVYSKRGSAKPGRVSIPLPPLWVRSEGGLMGMVADPDAASKRFYTCQSVSSGSEALDVRVLRWRLTSDTVAVADGDPVVTGIPLVSGRHAGCRLTFGPDGMLYVGTGDAATAVNPQDRQRLGGKVLRVKPNGDIPTDNPFYAEGRNARYVWTYGHRNVQGLAVRPGTSELWSAEQGTGRDDEVNVSVRGANYGWDPKPQTSTSPAYDESNEMTDLTKFPNAQRARWSSGDPTVATSGMTFLTGAAWGHWEGTAAVAMLKNQGIMLLFLDPTGRVLGSRTIEEVHSFGRIRSVQMGPDGALWFSTSDGDGNDVIAKVTATSKPSAVTKGKNVSGVGVSAVRTGSVVSAFVRTTDNKVVYKRSTDDGRTWPSSFASTGLTSGRPPAVASSAAGRTDLITTSATGVVAHTAFTGTTKKATTGLGGIVQTVTASSLGDGTLDVFGLGRNGSVYRQHFDGTRWSGWQRVGLDAFSSTVGTSVTQGSSETRITARGLTGQIYERTVTPTSNGSTWTRVAGSLWSGRALGDRFANQPLVSVSRGSDSYLRFQRGGLAMGLETKLTSEPDVVTRPDGSWIAFGRGTANNLVYFDARPGGYATKSLGGALR